MNRIDFGGPLPGLDSTIRIAGEIPERRAKLTKGPAPRLGVRLRVLREGLAIDSLDVPGLYVGTSTGQVFVSADEGERWHEVASYLPGIASVEVAVVA